MEGKIISTGSSAGKKLFIALGENKKEKILINKHYQFDLSSSVTRMIEFSFNRNVFSYALSELMNFLTSEESSSFSYPFKEVAEFNMKLESVISQVQDEILIARNLQKNIEENESFCEISENKFETFTFVSDQIRIPVEKQASLLEWKTKYSSQCFYLESVLKQMLEKKEYVKNEFKNIIEGIIQQFLSLKLKIEEKRLILNKMMEINVFDFLINETNSGFQIENQIKELQECIDQVAILKSQKISHQLVLSKEINYNNIIQELMNKHSQLEIEKLIEPLYLADLENLITKKRSLEYEIQLYSPEWLMKQYEKNLNILLSDLNLIIKNFQKVTVSKFTLNNFNIVHLKELTIDNYKKSYMKDETQNMIYSFIKISRLNLELLNQSLESLNVYHLSVNSKIVAFLPIIFSIDIDLDEKYKIILDKIQYLNDSIIEVYKIFRNMEIHVVDGITVPARYKKVASIEGFEYRQYGWLVQQSEATHGILESVLLKPDSRFYNFTNQLFFLNHEKFKNTRETLNKSINQIKSLENRNEIKENIKKDIEKLELQLYEKSNEVLMIILDNLKNETKSKFENLKLFQYFSINRVSIDKETFIFILGSLTKKMSLTKKKLLKKSKKVHEKNSLTLKELLQGFFEIAFNTNIDKVQSSKVLKEWITQMVPIDLEKFSKFLVSEKIFGSYLDDFQQPQKIIERKVAENCYQTLNQLCVEIGNIMFYYNRSQKEPSRMLEEYRSNLLKILQELEPKLYEFLSKFRIN